MSIAWKKVNVGIDFRKATSRHAHTAIVVGTFMYDYLVRHYRITDVSALAEANRKTRNYMQSCSKRKESRRIL